MAKVTFIKSHPAGIAIGKTVDMHPVEAERLRKEGYVEYSGSSTVPTETATLAPDDKSSKRKNSKK